jgi:uncharacterized membrane protein YdbT with pleckstrin-like domain
MAETVIRPSMKLVRIGYTIVFVVIFACVLAAVNWEPLQSWPSWLLVLPALLLLLPLRSHIRRSFTKLTILDDKLRYEAGILSKTTRNLQVAKVQDARVDQSVWQRMFATGDLSIETAGETGQLTMPGIDNPQQVAERILAVAASQTPKGKP